MKYFIERNDTHEWAILPEEYDHGSVPIIWTNDPLKCTHFENESIARNTMVVFDELSNDLNDYKCEVTEHEFV